jgi:hypothetical protein
MYFYLEAMANEVKQCEENDYDEVAVKKFRMEKCNMMLEYKGKVGHCDRNMGHGNHLKNCTCHT